MASKFLIKYKNVDKKKSFIPNSLKQTDLDILFFDYYVFLCKNKENLFKNLQVLTNSSNEVEKVYIDYDRDKTNYMYSPCLPIFNNKYIEKMMEEGEPGKYKYIKPAIVTKNNGREEEIAVVDPLCEPFKDMCNFVFNNIEADVQNGENVFLGNIYNVKSDLNLLIHQYSELYKAVFNETANSEELEELSRKKTAIIKNLSMYRNYRSMAKHRNIYELKMKAEEEKEIAKAINDSIKAGMDLSSKPVEFKSDEDIINEFYANGEIFDEEELREMAPEGSYPIYTKR